MRAFFPQDGITRRPFIHAGCEAALVTPESTVTFILMSLGLSLGLVSGAEFLLQAAPFSTDEGRDLLATIMLMALLPPIQGWTESVVRYMTLRGFRTLEEDSASTLEEVSAAAPEQAPALLGAFLARHGVHAGSLYARSGAETFRLVAAESVVTAPAELTVKRRFDRAAARQRCRHGNPGRGRARNRHAGRLIGAATVL